jgi:hypothetical protein
VEQPEMTEVLQSSLELRRFSPSIVRYWLHSCEKQHGTLCSQHVNQGPEIFIFLLDVREQKIVQASNSWRYCSFSYVWGAVSSLSLMTDTLQEMKVPGSLATMRNQIPKVIRDAMDVVTAIGERYLWVDSLCIVQDDDDHKHSQISQMDSIYSHSTLTIVALSAENANQPLLPIHKEDASADEFAHAVDFIQKAKNIEFHCLTTRSYTTSFSSALAASVYETRGWCLQERLLSKRVLYISNHVLYFECRAEMRSSIFPLTNLNSEGSRYSNWIPSYSDGMVFRRSPFDRYAWFVQEYTPKVLSFPTDILKAFSGLSRSLGMPMNLKPMKTFLCGQP